MEITKESIPGIVRATRKSLSLTQSDLAARAGCSQRLVSDLERGATGASYDKVLSILSALELVLDARPNIIQDPRNEVSHFVEEASHKDLGTRHERPKLSSYLES